MRVAKKKKDKSRFHSTRLIIAYLRVHVCICMSVCVCMYTCILERSIRVLVRLRLDSLSGSDAIR